MYVCSNCGMAFDGRVCPGCCTMRPAAAVLGSSGRILKDHNATVAAPDAQAAKLAEELEYSRQASQWRSQQQKRDEEMRARAARLAQAAGLRREEQPPEPKEPEPQESPEPRELTEAEQRYIQQAHKAVNWTRKAPMTRSTQQDVDDVELPDALRTLRISAAASQKRENPVRPPAPSAAERPASDIPKPGGRTTGRAPAGSERIDAAWRSFANKEPPSGKNVIPKLSAETAAPRRNIPCPPPAPSKKG